MKPKRHKRSPPTLLPTGSIAHLAGMISPGMGVTAKVDVKAESFIE
jgi:hypothetical protein